MSAELAIRGGTVVDGTGSRPVRADVGVSDGRIVEIAARVTGTREIDAAGRLVTPGFIDIHTHYDPQVLWDSSLSPSCWHGVTSVVAGNCGYSIAPTRAENRDSLFRTLDKVEDMRFDTLAAGVQWDFETYPEYLDTVQRRGIAINFGGYVGHTPVRVYVMGDEAYERVATDEEVGRMAAIVRDSVLGGALGFSTDRAGFHIGDGGRPVPSIVATEEETQALMCAVGEAGRGIVRHGRRGPVPGRRLAAHRGRVRILTGGVMSPSPAASSVLAGLDSVRAWQEDFYRGLHQHPELSHDVLLALHMDQELAFEHDHRFVAWMSV